MLPELLWPPKGKYGLRDYDKIFCPAIDGSEEFHDARQIDRDAGCMVIVRPDQHVANVLPLDNYANLANFFDRFMLPVAS